jgi:hypothetical protein
MESEIQMVELIKFEPVTLERLGCIPTRSIGTRISLFYLKLFLIMTVFGKISLFEFEFLNNTNFCLFSLKSMALNDSWEAIKSSSEPVC